jgi:hypothetical protein
LLSGVSAESKKNKILCGLCVFAVITVSLLTPLGGDFKPNFLGVAVH